MEISDQHILNFTFEKGEDDDEVAIFLDLVKLLYEYNHSAGFLKKKIPFKNKHIEFIRYMHDMLIPKEDKNES